MNKQTLPIVIACLLALFGVQFVVNKIYPPIPRKPQPVAGAGPPHQCRGNPAAAPRRPPHGTIGHDRPEQVVTLSNDLSGRNHELGGRHQVGGTAQVPDRAARAGVDVPGNAVFTSRSPPRARPCCGGAV